MSLYLTFIDQLNSKLTIWCVKDERRTKAALNLVRRDHHFATFGLRTVIELELSNEDDLVC